ncbi:MAG: extracellular solute-binding protein [Calditrichaeota bacterium]|nr:MAG: extracellular solute-binding protein [Calditrichota bacterium]
MRKLSVIPIAVMVVAALLLAACGGATPTPAPEQPAAEAPQAEQPAAPTPTEEPAAQAEPTEAPAAEEAPAGERVQIRWFVGLGTGGNPEQVEAQNAVVKQFNESQDEIELVLEIVQNDVAYDTLSTQIASGNAPDIVGPVGIRGANSFNGRWLDLEPLVESTGYDLSQFPKEMVDFWRTDEGLVGLPFGVFPALIFYNKALFDEAGLPYPPQEFGADYDGKPWDVNTVAEIAKILTVDANGNDATSPDFDPENIVQFGFEEQWSEPQRFATMFGAGSVVDENGNAQIPEQWREAFRWYYDAVWNQHFIPNDKYRGSDLLAAGNPFDSGNVAMAHTHLWYTCCLTGVGEDWDIAVVPAYNGKYTAALHADVFRILNTTEHPEEAFKVLTYLIGEAAPQLLEVYGAMPARTDLQDDFFARLDEKYPQGVNWQVAVDSLAYPDVPSHEQDMPNFLKAQDRFGAFWSALNTTPDLDVDAEVDKLQSDLQTIFQEQGN